MCVKDKELHSYNPNRKDLTLARGRFHTTKDKNYFKW